jgi:hypothetical protein
MNERATERAYSLRVGASNQPAKEKICLDEFRGRA